MIEKLITLQNVGRFSKLNIKGSTWDGVFSRANLIYAPNGSGKTTLSLVFQSLKDNDELLQRKVTFDDQRAPEPDQLVRLRIDGKTIEYKDKRWSTHLPELEIFNIHFIESTLFTGSTQLNHNKQNLFTYLSGAEGFTRKTELTELRTKRFAILQQERSVKSKARKAQISKAEREEQLKALRASREPIAALIAERNEALGLYSQKLFQEFTEKVNHFLSKFSRSLRLEKISKELDQRTTFYLQFGANRVTFNPRPNGHEFRYTLSEGDKNALAFAVFLAQVAFAPDPSKLILVFDDPLTSLDSGRRFLTIKELARLSLEVQQLIVLTHDASFAADLEREIRAPSVSLELKVGSSESVISRRDHQGEHITGLFRDLRTLTSFKDAGAQSQSDLREVLRCIRPTLEGFVRVKYFDRISRNQWLGDFIDAVRNAPEGDDLARLRNTTAFEDLCEVNDYSKRLHHSSPNEPDAQVEEQELQIMVSKTLQLLKLL